MSWSIYRLGKAAALKAALVKDFEGAKNSTSSIEHEHESVVLAEQVVNGQLDFFAKNAPNTLLKVECSGSACIAPPGTTWTTSSQVSIAVSAMGQITE